MPMTVKELYIAKDMEELEKRSDIDIGTKIKNKSINSLSTSAFKIYSKAKNLLEEEEKDEELAYMYLFRSMALWSFVMTSNEFKENGDKKYFTLLHGSFVKENMDLLEILKKKLLKRYDDLKNGMKESNDNFKEKFALTTSIVSKKRKESNTITEDNSTNNIMNDIVPAIYLENHYIKPSENVELCPKKNDDFYGGRKFINCKELRDCIIPASLNLLIIDIRPKEDFTLSKIDRVHCINIPEKSIAAGLSANKLGAMITNIDEKYYWNHRDEYTQVVLMDWFSQEKHVIPGSPLSNLLNILLKWDPGTIYKNKPLILNGGYETFLDMYPTLSTNPKAHPPQRPVTNQFIHFSEHLIEYPMNELDEIASPKPKIPIKPVEVFMPKYTGMPTVDRSTKPETSVGKSEKAGTILRDDKEVKSPISDQSLCEDPMEEEKVLIDEKSETTDPSPSSITASPERPKDGGSGSQYPHVLTPPVRPATPPRPIDKSYPITPKIAGKGDSEGGIFTERLKFDGVSLGGLKRSASSPNINKLANEELDISSKLFNTPTFDRSTKPMLSYDGYSQRDVGTDTTICSPNSKKAQGLTGLKNLGNLCYMNSIMQCISNTVELTKELTRFDTKETSTKRQIASEVSSLLRTVWTGGTKITSCRNLKMKVGSLRSSFATMEQQDSHEFLTLLMDWLHEDLNEPSSIKSLDGADEATGEKAWGEFKKKNNSLILDLFYGQLKSTVTCNHCHKQSILFEPFSNLSVPLPSPQDSFQDKDRTFSLQDCLKLYLKGEIISGWVCPSCKTPREATKKLDITRLPPVLIVHLKRFMNDMVGVGWCRKRMNMVDFPINDLDMKPYTHADSELRFHNYNLYAVSNHYGSMESGHYTAYCKNHMLNKWHRFDDHDVFEISPGEVKTSAAYILFYESRQYDKNTRLLD